MREARRSRHELLIALEVPWSDDIAMKMSIGLSQLVGGRALSLWTPPVCGP